MAGGQGPREGYRLQRRETLEGISPWTLRRASVGRAGGKSRAGGIQTSNVAPGGGGIRCRDTYPPAWDCVVGREKSRRGSVVCPAGKPAGRHGLPVMNSEEEWKSTEGRLTLRRKADVSAECPRGDERRTGRVKPMSTLGCCIRVLEGPHNLRRVGGRPPQAGRPDC